MQGAEGAAQQTAEPAAKAHGRGSGRTDGQERSDAQRTAKPAAKAHGRGSGRTNESGS